MAKPRNSPSSSSDRRQWERIFNALVELMKSQQSQIETLVDDRKFLEQYIHLQHDHFSSRARFLESHIAQLKKEEAKGRKIQTAKVDLMVEAKQRDVLWYKKQYELAESDLEDFRVCVEDLSSQISELKEKLITGEAGKSRKGVGDSSHGDNSKEEEWCMEALKGDLRKLKHSYKKLSSKKEAEVSSLLAEKDFVWNQLKKMENDYITALKSRKIELEHANEAVEKLQNNLQNLQKSADEKDQMIAELHSLAKEKDDTIAKLRDDLSKLAKCTIGKSRLSKENSESASQTPSESNPRKSSRKRKSESTEQGTTQKHKRRLSDDSPVTGASAPVHALVRCSSRRTAASASMERPPLFHSNFKKRPLNL
ncbi:uncharacterized protein A4U43_C10F3810 [Asparagus officinalis]|uniref:Uncharacterized protein n=1 Tax=Asparagus officinalis TaxID=4686 RepID=A0A5P1E0Q2_ASPOF|nr:uncharacterized protein A4U43_C10F3810 [Asparagus officinalis]